MTGARMIPAVCPANAPEGERKLFCLLRDDPGAKGWIVLHSLDIARHVMRVSGEADFVILIPDEGVVVVEVKSHKNIKYDGYGWWLGSELQPDLRGPFKQASEAMHSIISEVHRIKKGCQRIPFVSAVAFTACSFSQKSSEWNEWQVLDKQKLSARPISEILLSVIRNACSLYASKGLTWAQGGIAFSAATAHALALHLRPFFELMVSPAVERKALDEDLLRCTMQQYAALDHLAENERLLFTGPAGTGKTCLAVEAVRRDAVARPNGRRALLCFNRNLGLQLQSHCQENDISCTVATFHKWLLEYAGLTAPDIATADFWQKKLPGIVADKIVAKGTSPFDYLVVDEAQDLFSADYLELIDMMVEGGLGSGRWVFFADYNNQGYALLGKTVPKSEFRKQWATSGFVDYVLDVNCRNTLEISQFISLLAPPLPAYSSTLRSDTHHDPELLFYTSSEEQSRLVDTALDELLGAGFRDSDIAILSPLADASCAVALSRAPRWKGRMRQCGYPGSGIRYSTVHAFKGLESPVVIITDIHMLDKALQKKLLYVGMSRALHRLVILAHESTKDEIRKAVN